MLPNKIIKALGEAASHPAAKSLLGQANPFEHPALMKQAGGMVDNVAGSIDNVAGAADNAIDDGYWPPDPVLTPEEAAVEAEQTRLRLEAYEKQLDDEAAGIVRKPKRFGPVEQFAYKHKPAISIRHISHDPHVYQASIKVDGEYVAIVSSDTRSAARHAALKAAMDKLKFK